MFCLEGIMVTPMYHAFVLLFIGLPLVALLPSPYSDLALPAAVPLWLQLNLPENIKFKIVQNGSVMFGA